MVTLASSSGFLVTQTMISFFLSIKSCTCDNQINYLCVMMWYIAVVARCITVVSSALPIAGHACTLGHIYYMKLLMFCTHRTLSLGRSSNAGLNPSAVIVWSLLPLRSLEGKIARFMCQQHLSAFWTITIHPKMTISSLIIFRYLLCLIDLLLSFFG